MSVNPNWPPLSDEKPQWQRRLNIVCWCVLVVGTIALVLLHPSPLKPESPVLRVIRFTIIAAAVVAGLTLRIMGWAQR